MTKVILPKFFGDRKAKDMDLSTLSIINELVQNAFFITSEDTHLPGTSVKADTRDDFYKKINTVVADIADNHSEAILMNASPPITVGKYLINLSKNHNLDIYIRMNTDEIKNVDCERSRFDPLRIAHKQLLKHKGRKLFKNTDKVLALSHSLADRAASLGQTRKDIEVINQGIEDMFFEVDGGEGTITYIGRVAKKKRVSDFIKISERLKKDRYIKRARIVGDGPELPELKKNSPSFIDFLGYTPHADIPDVLSSTSVLIHPSGSEGLPTIVMEAMAAGVPVVASDVGGTGEVIEHGSNGYLFNPGDWEKAYEYSRVLIQNKNKREEISYLAKVYAENHFRLNKLKPKYNKLFNL